MKKLIAFSALMCLSLVAFAQSPVGTWKGKILMDASAMPKAENPQQQAAFDQAMKQVKSMVFNLEVKSNKTFVISMPGFGGQKPHKSEGTWTQKGDKITMITTKTDGKAEKDHKPQTMTIASTHKMTMTPADAAGVHIIFTK